MTSSSSPVSTKAKRNRRNGQQAVLERDKIFDASPCDLSVQGENVTVRQFPHRDDAALDAGCEIGPKFALDGRQGTEMTGNLM